MGGANPGRLAEFVAGVRIVVSGDAPRAGERVLLLPNHRTRMDWMLLWTALMDQGLLWRLIIVPKAEMRTLPFLGWAMELCSYIFLRRRWAEDRACMDRMVALHAADAARWPAPPGWVYMVFAEGTNMSTYTQSSSHKYADKEGLPRYRHVLHPRITGTVHLLHGLRQLDAVYDTTVAFRGPAPENESALVAGQMPESLHIHVRRLPASSVPEDDDGAAAWIRDRFREKEDRLAAFYRRPDSALGGSERPPSTDGRARAAAGILFLVAASVASCRAVMKLLEVGPVAAVAVLIAAAVAAGVAPSVFGQGYDTIDSRLWGAAASTEPRVG